MKLTTLFLLAFCFCAAAVNAKRIAAIQDENIKDGADLGAFLVEQNDAVEEPFSFPEEQSDAIEDSASLSEELNDPSDFSEIEDFEEEVYEFEDFNTQPLEDLETGKHVFIILIFVQSILTNF